MDETELHQLEGEVLKALKEQEAANHRFVEAVKRLLQAKPDNQGEHGTPLRHND